MKKQFLFFLVIMLVASVIIGCSSDDGDDDADNTAPGEVSGIVITKYADKAVITWTDPADSDLARIRTSSVETAFNNLEANAGVQSLELTGLVIGNEYSVTLKTVDTSGNESTGVLLNIRFHIYGFVRCIQLNQGDVNDIFASGIAVDSEGKIYVANHGGTVSGAGVESIVKYSADGTLVGSWEVQDTAADPPWDDIEGLCIATDPATGTEYIFIANCSGGCIDQYTTDLSTYALNRVTSVGSPIALWGSSSGTVYVITEDAGVESIDVASLSIQAIAGLPSGWEIALDSSGNFYIPDAVNDEIDVYNAQAVYQRSVSSLGFAFDAWWIAFTVGPDNCLIIADDVNDKILVYDLAGTKVLEWGTSGNATDGTQFNTPYRMTFDGQGLLYIVDNGNDRILVFNP